MSYYLTDGAHVLIAGATGAGADYGGKTVLANWWMDQSVANGWHDVGIFYNVKGQTFIRGERVTTLRALAQAYRAGERVFNFVPGSTYGVDEHEPLIRFLRRLPGSKIIAHDEAQAYKDTESLNWCLSQGGNLRTSREPTSDIRSLVLTQRPWNLPEEHRSNMPLKVWVGPFGQEARNYFQSEKMPAAADAVEQATGKHRWSVMDAGDYVETNAPVPGEYA